jgi:hypothetical protein
VEAERLERIALIVRAIDLTIAQVEARTDDDRDEQLTTLRYMRERWRKKLADKGGDSEPLPGFAAATERPRGAGQSS